MGSWVGAGLRKTCSSFLDGAGSYGTGNAGRNRLKRNRISPQAGRAELGHRVRAPNTQAAVPAPLRPAPGPLPRPPAPPGPRSRGIPGGRSPEVALGRRGPTSGGDRARLPAPGPSPPPHAVSHLLGLSRSPPAQVKASPRPQGPLGRRVERIGGLRSVFARWFGPGGRGPASFGCRLRELWFSRLEAQARPPPAVPGSRGDGRPLTRGAEAARRGLDHWAAEGAARRAGPARPGPLICLYYPRETKLPGTDARAPSFLRKPHHTLTSVPPARSPQTRRAPSRPPPAPRKAPGASAPRPASPEARPDPGGARGAGVGGPGYELLERGEKTVKEKKNSRKKSGVTEAVGTARTRRGKKTPNLTLQMPLWGP